MKVPTAAIRVLALLLTTCHAVWAGTIISVTGPHGSTLALGATNQFLATSWSSTLAYTNVTVGFESIFGPFTGTAWLMTQIGPGTTTAHQVASAPFTATAPGLALTTVFAQLDLAPGTYYLVLSADGVGGWDTPYSAGSAIVTLGTGVAWGSEFITNDFFGGPNLLFPPASTFQFLNPAYDLKFDVQGEAVPEPSSYVLVGWGMALLAAIGRSAGRRRQLL